MEFKFTICSLGRVHQISLRNAFCCDKSCEPRKRTPRQATELPWHLRRQTAGTFNVRCLLGSNLFVVCLTYSHFCITSRHQISPNGTKMQIYWLTKEPQSIKQLHNCFVPMFPLFGGSWRRNQILPQTEEGKFYSWMPWTVCHSK